MTGPRSRPTADPGGTAFSVELVGLPGSGKSRLARTLTTGLTAAGVPVNHPRAPFDESVSTGRRLLRKGRVCVATLWTAPRRTAVIGWALLRSDQAGPADLAARFVQLLVAQEVAVRAARHGGVSIVDEGVVQSLWSIGLRGSLAPVLGAVSDGAAPPAADLLVLVQVPPDLALARLAARSSRHSRVQRLAESERMAALIRGSRLLDDLVDWWAAQPGRREVVVVPGPEEAGDDREQLLRRVLGAVGPGGSPGTSG